MKGFPKHWISDVTRERLHRFRELRRAWWSFWILLAAFGLSLFSPLIANDRPLVLGYQGKIYFPIFNFQPASTFGGQYATEADYLALRGNEEFNTNQGWMWNTPISVGPLSVDFSGQGQPPYAPSRAHWLGTDSTGRDILARLIYGFRICMLFAISLTILEAFFGILIGGIQGYLGGWWDILIQRSTEIWSALPFLYVVILLGSIYGQNFFLLLFITSLFGWIGLSYYMRGEFYKIKSMPYVKAARALGLSPYKIFTGQILPNALTPVLTILPFALIGGIGALTSLDFLGFGLPPPTPSWGEMLSDGLRNLQAPWIAFSATVALFVTLLLATFIGEGVREAFDPKGGSRLE